MIEKIIDKVSMIKCLRGDLKSQLASTLIGILYAQSHVQLSRTGARVETWAALAVIKLWSLIQSLTFNKK